MRYSVPIVFILTVGVYSTPVHSPRQNAIVYYDLPTPNSGPCDLDDGPNGTTIWYYSQVQNKVGVINTTSGGVRDWTVPWTGSSHPQPITVSGQVAQVCAVRKGTDNFIYITSNDRSQVAQVNPETYEIRIANPIQYDPPEGTNPALNEMLPFGDSVVITHFYERLVTELYYNGNDSETSTLTSSYYDRKSLLGIQKNFQGIQGGDPQQCYWITEFSNNTIYQDALTTRGTTSFDVPIPGGEFPSSFRASTGNGRYLWANAFVGGGLIRFDSTDEGPLQVYNYPDEASTLYPQQNDVDPDGNIWISSYNLKRLVYFTPSTGDWTTIQLPTGDVDVTGDKFVAVHYGTPLNAMWFTSVGTNQIGAYKL